MLLWVGLVCRRRDDKLDRSGDRIDSGGIFEILCGRGVGPVADYLFVRGPRRAR